MKQNNKHSTSQSPITLLGALLITTILAACSSAPIPIEYYLLDTGYNTQAHSVIHSHDAHNTTELPRVLLKNLTIANYLEQNELSILEANHKIYYANQHLWGEPIKVGLARALQHDLAKSKSALLVLPNEPDALEASTILTVKIDHFSATDSGEVILTGTFWIDNGQHTVRIPFNETEILESTGFKFAVTQQRQLIQNLSEIIAQAMKPSPSPL
ncbi:membrane integrity-associated transporter subunit PqiC [Marinibactrum halimedae]|uniref:PqiC family protein n=1 Tax=Marinibactrum halimedae TaxID=1444977 RepID=UPI001E64E14F|nr:ABC-type transport auxiliary lipoprotein family protein [Marinibactrum halimedae]MCD9460553.1 ABC-type transport auxiliary lipoprotein family protein [Marinibactrum halimedae]